MEQPHKLNIGDVEVSVDKSNMRLVSFYGNEECSGG